MNTDRRRDEISGPLLRLVTALPEARCVARPPTMNWTAPDEPTLQSSPNKQTVETSHTTVVRIRRQGGQVTQGCDVYIGRQVSRGGWDLPRSKWANPFSVAQCGSAADAVEKFETYIMSNIALLAHLPELKGKVLGCWCKPGPCHGDVLATLANTRSDGDS